MGTRLAVDKAARTQCHSVQLPFERAACGVVLGPERSHTNEAELHLDLLITHTERSA